MLLEAATRALTWWASVRSRASQDEGVAALEIGVFAGLLLVIIVIALSLVRGQGTQSFHDLNVNYP